MVWYSTSIVWCGLLRFEMVCGGMVCSGIVGCGMVWYGMVLYGVIGMVWCAVVSVVYGIVVIVS
jgi:hypothetical protein